MTLHRILSIATTAIILVSFSSVSRAEKNDTAEDCLTSIRFTCATLKELRYEEIFYREGEEYQLLKLFPGRCSQLYPLKGVDELEFYIRKEDKEGELAYELIGLAPLIKGAEQMLFLVEEIDDLDGLPLRLIGFDDSLDVFPAGAFRFVNLTAGAFQVTLGEHNAELAPSLFVIMKPQAPQGASLIPFYLKDHRGVLVYENRLFEQATARQTVVIYPPSKKGSRIKLKFFSQPLPAESSRLMDAHSSPFVAQSI